MYTKLLVSITPLSLPEVYQGAVVAWESHFTITETPGPASGTQGADLNMGTREVIPHFHQEMVGNYQELIHDDTLESLSY